MTSFGLTCFAVHAISARRTVAGAASRAVDACARREAEGVEVGTDLCVAETRDLVVSVAFAEIALAVPQEGSSCKQTALFTLVYTPNQLNHPEIRQ